mmetsp:Transcript_9552/g.23522  ORF Transcript_9552/g.23522 Transcript_9552/m.23522 type:complete len:176 (-) Transcript_9552:676-1203(-)
MLHVGRMLKDPNESFVKVHSIKVENEFPFMHRNMRGGNFFIDDTELGIMRNFFFDSRDALSLTVDQNWTQSHLKLKQNDSTLIYFFIYLPENLGIFMVHCRGLQVFLARRLFIQLFRWDHTSVVSGDVLGFISCISIRSKINTSSSTESLKANLDRAVAFPLGAMFVLQVLDFLA